MFKGNFHTHTTFCDGMDTAQEMADRAYAMGFTHLGFSGHMDPDIRMDLEAYDTEIRRLQAVYRGRMDILRGVELDGLYRPGPSRPGREAATGTEKGVPGAEYAAAGEGAAPKAPTIAAGVTGAEYAAAGQGQPAGAGPEEKGGADERALLDGMEYLIGSTHFIESPAGGLLGSVDDTWERMQAFCREEFGGDYYRLSKAYYRTEAEIFARTRCTFIGHFDLVTCFNDKEHFLEEEDPRYYMPALETMEYLVSKGLPFEINCGAFNRGRKAELYPNRFLLKRLREMDGQILISADAHQKELLAGGFEAAVRTAMECGFTHTNYLAHDGQGRIVFCQVPLDTQAGIYGS